MSIERTYYCDGPRNTDIPNGDAHDRCPAHATTATSHLPHGFLRVVWDDRTLHFCGWDCVLRYAAEQPPVEIIEL